MGSGNHDVSAEPWKKGPGCEKCEEQKYFPHFPKSSKWHEQVRQGHNDIDNSEKRF